MKRKGSDFLAFFATQGVRGQRTELELPQGWLLDFTFEEVPEPKWETVCGEIKPSLQPGFRWIYWIPRQANHTLLAFLNENNTPEWLYSDVIETAGLDESGLPWTDDLYLDVTALCEVRPDGSWQVTDTEIIDQDKLDEALAGGKITQAQYDLAWREANTVQDALKANAFAPAEVIRQYLTDPYT